jgi:hypothetical protein
MKIRQFFKDFKFIILNYNTPKKLIHWVMLRFAQYIIFTKNDGFYILDEPWDNLIILDACRYDVFELFYKKKYFKGTLFKKISRATHTIQFLKVNFPNEKYDDIVYITSTPYVDVHCKNKFHKIISVWKDSWNKYSNTILPETMYNYAIDALIKYPDKRLIIHFMQPHYPYIGCTYENIIKNAKKKIKKRLKEGESVYFGDLEYKRSIFSYYTVKPFALMETRFHIKAYIKNLIIVLPIVEKLINHLPGTTVISSDHGEALGEKLHRLIPVKFYGHALNIRIPSLIDLPWLVIKPNEKELHIDKDFKEKEIINKVLKKNIII